MEICRIIAFLALAGLGRGDSRSLHTANGYYRKYELGHGTALYESTERSTESLDSEDCRFVFDAEVEGDATLYSLTVEKGSNDYVDLLIRRPALEKLFEALKEELEIPDGVCHG